MKILLLGEYSNLHWTLGQGLKCLGHDVTVASNGDNFKNYPRHINLLRNGYGIIDSVKYLSLLATHFWNFKGYDVVQLINPFFLDLKADRNLQLFNYLKKNNGKVFMGAFGDDCYWLQACLGKQTFRYSEFDIPNRDEQLKSAQQLIATWSNPDKIRVNREIAERSDGIIACLYEYYVAYLPHFADKLTYIAEPINTSEQLFSQRDIGDQKLRFFIGIQTLRSEIKGTDWLYQVLQDVYKTYPDQCNIVKAESVPYKQYCQMMRDCDVLLDQLYSYSPSMNALAAMAQGLVVVSGGEPEIYELLKETSNKPIVNVLPTKQSIFEKLEGLIQKKDQIAQLSTDSCLFIEKHHDYIKIAQQYFNTWSKG
ncbi:MAG: hypothetical protein RL662_1299 [Bacteroidota bacterium]|jgi:hypothetical protein